MTKPPLTPEEMQAKIRSGEMKFEIAPQDKVNKLDEWVQQVLEAVGHPEACVTDESIVWDFVGSKDPERIKSIGNTLGFTITKSDYIYELAERLRDREESGLEND